MIIDIAPKFYSTLSLPTGQGHGLRNFMLKFYLSVLKIYNYSMTFQIILFIFGIQIVAMEDVRPKLYPVRCTMSSSKRKVNKFINDKLVNCCS